MEKRIVLPIKPMVIYVEETEWILPSTFDFSKLPHVCDQADQNSDIPFLSESIINSGFAKPSHPLEKGVHLHWILPPMFRKSLALPVITKRFVKAHTNSNEENTKVWNLLSGMKDEVFVPSGDDTLIAIKPFELWKNLIPEWFKALPGYRDFSARFSGDTADGLTFPAVPNRWEIMRLKNGVPDKEWVVESDFVHPGKPESNEHRYSIFPWFDAYSNSDGVPLRYIGRVYEKSEQVTASGTYLHEHPVGPLTARGYGDLSFAAYYPDCKSVFGLYDDGIRTPEELKNLEYRITGTYDNKSPNYWNQLRSYLTGFLQAEAREKQLEKNEDKKILNQWIKERLDLSVGLEVDQLNANLYCHGTVRMADAVNARQINVGIAVGNSGTEAIAAAIATEIAPDDLEKSNRVENLIESVLLNDRIAHLSNDLGLKFNELRHENEFYSKHGGVRWRVQAENSESVSGRGQKKVVPHALREALDQLNFYQQSFEEVKRKVQSAEQQVFDYWHHYMQAKYVNEFEIDTYPTPDDIKDLIDQKLIVGLESLRTDLEQKNNQLEEAWLAAKRTTDNSDFSLTSGPAVRFWMPREPVICISEQMLEGVLHADARHKDENDLYKALIYDFDPGIGSNKLNLALPLKANEIFENLVDPTKGTGNPLLLDWEVEFFPVKGDLKPVFVEDQYTEDYITANFQLEENNPELVQNPKADLVSEKSEVYIGQSILNPFSQTEVRKKLLDHCNFLLETEGLDLAELKKKASGDSYFAGQLDILFEAINRLDKNFKLTQSLSGFNNLLQGRRFGWQFPIADPIGFKDYQDFAKRVNDVVSPAINSSPVATRSFHPIRSGQITIPRLRLVDNFGRLTDLSVKKIVGSRGMSDGQSNRVNMPPRILQAARINMRWLDGFDKGEAHEYHQTSPVSGWFLPEYLNDRILVFDGNGSSLGVLTQNGWENTFSEQGPVEITEIPRLSLRLFCQHLLEIISQKGIKFLLDGFKKSDSQIQPEHTDDGDFQALIFGQPLALMNASIAVELNGEPHTSVTWDECWSRLTNPDMPQADAGLPQVDIKVRIGEHHQLNDGVFLYWEWQKINPEEWGITSVQTPQNSGENFIGLKLNAAPKQLGILLHPRGKVHITCGILPVKSIDLPVSYIEQAMTSLKGNLFVGPLLTNPEEIQLPLARLSQHEWQWISPQTDKKIAPWQNRPPRLPDGLIIREGWLQINEKKKN